MRIHLNLKKALAIVTAIESVMEKTGLHVHGLSGAELGQLTTDAISTGRTIKESVTALGLEAKAAATAPEAQ